MVGLLGSLWTADRLCNVFEARELEVASRLLGRSHVLERGALGSPDELVRRLERLGYRRTRGSADRPGTYTAWGQAVQVYLRERVDDGDRRPATLVRARFEDGRILSVDKPGAALEPETLTLFYGPEMEERELVEVSEVPKHLIDAILAAEDRRFFTHPGLDPFGILRAAWANLTSASLSQGGSTLTQQLAKNLYFTGERSFVRKSKEAFAAVVLEARYSKERLLRAYINEVYLGQRGPASVRGVARAARHYFGKPVRDLTVAESALLAGMIQAPGRYNPRVHPDRAVARRSLVLDAMVEIGALTPEQRRAAAAEPLRTVPAGQTSPATRAAYVADTVRQGLIAEHGLSFWQRGLEVHSSIDPLYQEAAEAAVRDGLERLARDWSSARKGRDGSPLQAALVAMDPKDGSILALVGGRSFAGSQFNRVTSARRQPGSLFKPVVYMAGLTHPGDERDKPGWLERLRRRWTGNEEIVRGPGEAARAREVLPVRKKRRWWSWGDEDDEEEIEVRPPTLPLSAATLLHDEPYQVESGGKVWAPENWDHRFRGAVTVQRALEESLNVPTARLAAAVGFARVVRTARALGIRSSMPEVPSLALGTAEVTPLEMATAFATIAGGGTRVAPYMIQRIEDADGRARSLRAGWPFPPDPEPSLESASSSGRSEGPGPRRSGGARLPVAPAREDRPERVEGDDELVPHRQARLMTALLRGVMVHGTGRTAAALGFHGVAAGKTGTSDGGRDLWFCGYTPDLLALVWVGFDDGTPTHLSGARGALPIWVDFMKAVGAETLTPFEGEELLLWAPIDPATGQLARSRCPETRWAPFIPGTEPVLRCTEHRGFWSRFRD